MLNTSCVCHTISSDGIVHFETQGFSEEFGSHLYSLDFVIQGQYTAASPTSPIGDEKTGF